jgi:hypothetical protein
VPVVEICDCVRPGKVGEAIKQDDTAAKAII